MQPTYNLISDFKKTQKNVLKQKKMLPIINGNKFIISRTIGYDFMGI